MSQPVFKRELGHLSVAVFDNERDGGGSFRSIALSRRYFDRDSNEWKATSASINPADAPAVIRLLQALEAWLIEPSAAS